MDIKYIIEKKRNNKVLSKEEINFVIKNYVNKRINDEDMGELLLLICEKSLSFKETLYMTEAMIKSGEVIDFYGIEKPLVDKHSTGGIGDKVSLIALPIVASLGVCVAKMSGKGLGYTGGTIDKLESIKNFRTNLSKAEFMTQVKDINVALISQSDNIAVADKKIYALRDQIGAVESIPLIASSIMSKKIASGAKNIVIDMKVGEGALIKNMKDASTLAKTMKKIGNKYKKHVTVVMTDMNTPLGYAIGNTLEVKEAIDFFEGKYEARLFEVVETICTYMLHISLKISLRKCKKMYKKSLDTGIAKNKFYDWIKAQNGDISSLQEKALKMEIKSNKNGYINSVDALNLGKLACSLGAGRVKKEDNINHAVGIVLNKTLGDKVNENETLATIYYEYEIVDMDETLIKSFEITSEVPKKEKVILKII